MRIKNFVLRPSALIMLSAVLSALPLTFECLFPLSWVSFVPFFYSIVKNPPVKIRQMIGRGILFGVVYHICIYYWFVWFYPLDYAKLNNILSVAVVCLAWFGISLLHGSFWCVPTLLAGFVNKRIKNPAIILAMAILGIMLSQKIPQLSELAFPWVRVSLGQYRQTALIQSASLFGIDGVDMIILSVNMLIALAICLPKNAKKWAALGAVFIFSANLCFGLVRLNTETETAGSLNILTIQGGIDKVDKWKENGAEYCFETYKGLTLENMTDQTDLVIWPESAVPVEYKSEKGLKKYKKLSKKIKTPILAGILKKENGIPTNNTILMDEKTAGRPYTKRILVPFGEYMPYRGVLSKVFSFLENINVLAEDYGAGQNSALIDLSGHKLGNIICFESVYPQLSRQSVKDGAELLIEVTNDSWLKDSPAMEQHLAHGVFRCVENSRALVRSANSGISATVDSKGRVEEELGALKQGVISAEVDFEKGQTLYTKTGDIILPIYALAVALLLAVFSFKNSKEKRSKHH